MTLIIKTINNKVINKVEIIFLIPESLFLFSTIFLRIPFWSPSVETDSTEVKKFLKFPINAIPWGPTKIAKNFDTIIPLPSFNKILKLFKEVILNKGVRIMDFIKLN